MPCVLTVEYVGQFRAGEHCFKCILSTVEMGADRRAGEMEPGYRLCCSARGAAGGGGGGEGGGEGGREGGGEGGGEGGAGGGGE